MPPKVLKQIKEERRKKWKPIIDFIRDNTKNLTIDQCEEFMENIQEILVNNNPEYAEYINQ